MRVITLFLVTVLTAGCEATCRELQSAGTPIIQIQENIDHNARQAGISEGELQQVATEVLEREGLRLAQAGEKPNVTIEIDVNVMGPALGQHVGLVEVSIREPVTVWIGHVNATATTTSNSFVFRAPTATVREYVSGNLRDVLRGVVRAHGRLRPGTSGAS